MFADDPEVAPISMILTNLSGQAYGGEPDVYLAVRGILSRMLDFVRPEPWRAVWDDFRNWLIHAA
jgi:hypothetical protein